MPGLRLVTGSREPIDLDKSGSEIATGHQARSAAPDALEVVLAAPTRDNLDPGVDGGGRLGPRARHLDLHPGDEWMGASQRHEVVDAELDAGDLRRILDEDRHPGRVRDRCVVGRELR